MTIDQATLDALSGEELIAALGGREEAEKVYAELYYLREQPKACRTDLIELARYLKPDPENPRSIYHSQYMVARHHRLIAEAFERVMAGKMLKLILSIPPQHGKSQLAKTFLAAHIGRFPWKHLMMGTYNQTYADEYGEDVRAILQQDAYRRVYPKLRLRTGSKAKDHMVTEDGGKTTFIGRGAGGTGRPADGLLIDDPLKDAEEAASRATREKLWQWYTQVANARCHALTWQVIIATRWSDDDLIARLTDPKNPHYRKEVADQWQVINVPAIIDNEVIAAALGAKVGEALWPERFPLPLLETARSMNEVGFSALYMGRPTPPEGSFYRQADMQTYDSPAAFPRRCRAYLTGDLAVSTDKGADRSAVGMWGLDENDNLYLHYDLWWDRKSSDESVDAIIAMGKRYQVMEAFFEKGVLDRAIGPFLEKRMQESGAYFSLSKLPVSGDKGMRSQSIRGRMRQGKVFFPSFAPWWPAAKEEMLKFTGSGDDKADDFCLLGGTLIEMADGSQRRIEEIRVGDRVATPSGGRAVVAAGITNLDADIWTLAVGGSVLAGTGAHPIYSASRGDFVRMEDLCNQESVVLSKRWSTVAASTADTRSQREGTCGSTSTEAASAAGSFIATFGRIISGLSRMVMRFTTATETAATTSPAILSACLAASTSGSTCEIRRALPRRRGRWMGRAAGPLISTDQRRAGIGIPEAQGIGRVVWVGRVHDRGAVYNLTVEGEHCYYANGILTHNCDMIALIGQALGDTVRVGKGQTNVVNFPKVGTFGWTKHAANQEREAARRRAALRGM